MTISHEDAVVIDTKLAELHTELDRVYSKLDSNKFSLARHAGIRPTYVTRNRQEVKETASELAALVAGMVADGKFRAWDERTAREALAKRETLLGEAARLRAEIAPFEEIYRQSPWSRFFLVNNVGGHIHSSTACHSCNMRTQFGWLPALSGLTEKDAVDAHGTILCSHCFPTAPVEWTLGIQKQADPDECPGSGTWDHNSSGVNYYSPHAECNHCGHTTSITSTGKLRKHKKATA